MNNLIIIPALNPDKRLIDMVIKLKTSGLKNILVVDDGSSSMRIFNKLEKMDVKIIHHEVNKGKGCALKTAFANYGKYFKKIDGFITVDADGQHSVSDILNISNQLDKNIIFGVRNFKEKNVPFRSKFGNKFSSLFLYFSTGMKLNDTQTGLRAFPVSYKDFLLNIEGERFEYEMNVLMELAKNKENIISVPIETIYENDNKGSHFHALKDSMIIYGDFFRYVFVAILSAAIDLTLFTIFLKTNNIIMLSTICARIISGLINFILNKVYSFKANDNFLKQFILYLILFTLNMFVSGGIVTLLKFIPTSKTFIKAIVDIIIFLVNYYVQKRYIFKKSSK